jgi:hypothetical protein
MWPEEALIYLWLQWTAWLHSEEPEARAQAALTLLAWGACP